MSSFEFYCDYSMHMILRPNALRKQLISNISRRCFSYDEGVNLAKKGSLMLMECTAKSGKTLGLLGQISKAIVVKI
jgi:hypothetical protein